MGLELVGSVGTLYCNGEKLCDVTDVTTEIDGCDVENNYPRFSMESVEFNCTIKAPVVVDAKYEELD